LACHNMSLSKNAGGRHVLIESFGDHARLDAPALKRLLRRAARAGGANVLSCHMHGFGDQGGVTGVALLAESHITVHTWPERSYAAFDVFMCGTCDADKAVDVIARAAPGARLSIRALERPVLGTALTGTLPQAREVALK
ncbi:MAG: adenosylmethionine decarboxylase, partial [Gammaproteobacteria bacterium]|nr:adenosylmethionine decarboxylase [Gammaproteobacteria bacterium]